MSEEKLLDCRCGGKPQLFEEKIVCTNCKLTFGYKPSDDRLLPSSNVLKPLLTKRWNDIQKNGYKRKLN